MMFTYLADDSLKGFLEKSLMASQHTQENTSLERSNSEGHYMSHNFAMEQTRQQKPKDSENGSTTSTNISSCLNCTAV